jgi:hypothetical protein
MILKDFQKRTLDTLRNTFGYACNLASLIWPSLKLL